MADTAEVTDHPERRRFELLVDDQVAFAAYTRTDDVLSMTHTIVPQALAGRGIGTKLIAGALRQVRERGLTIIPLCGFVVAYLKTHPEDADLVAPRGAI